MSRSTRDSTSITPGQPVSFKPEESAPRKAVFLSHEGRNKIFAHYLFEELQNRNVSAFFDQDRESLPPGDRFPDKIIEGVRGCKLFICVLSESFVTKKWPMIELLEAYRQFKKRGNPSLLPIFYDLSVSDIDDQERWNRWSKEWQAKASTFTTLSNEKIAINASDCGQALKFITKQSGLSKKHQSDHDFVKTVADEICKRVPPDVWGIADTLHHKELFQVVKDKFGEINEEGPKLLGMWGEKNSGKSKVSIALCSHYFKEYNGIVQCVELAFESRSILVEVKKILQSLTNADWRLLDAITSLDLAINYLKTRIVGKRFFLAIDNVPGNDACRQGIRDLWLAIQSSDCKKSQVLLTARNRQHLESFLRQCGSSTQAVEVPQLQEQDTIDILVSFATNSKHTWKNFNKNQKAAIQELCHSPPIYNTSSEKFSPGEAKSVGLLIRGSEKEIAEDPLQWHSVVEAYCSSNTNLHQLFSESVRRTLERSMKDNAKVEQALQFIVDAALYEKAMGPTLNGIWRWLGIVHDITRKSVSAKFKKFKNYELIDWKKSEEDEDAETLEVRRVFIWPGFKFPKFATAEAQEKPSKWRWFYYDGRHPEEAPEDVKLERIEKMALVRGDFKDVAEVVTLRRCVGVVAFMMARCGEVERINVRAMKEQLQALEIENCVGLKKIKGVEEAKQLERLYVNYAPDWMPERGMLVLSALKRLQSVRLINTGMEDPPQIRGCPDLRELYIERNRKLMWLPELGNDLISLSHISFADNPKIRMLPDLSGLASSLTHLSVRNCAALANIKTLDSLTSLQCLNISSCRRLWVPLPDLTALGRNTCPTVQISAHDLPPAVVHKLWKDSDSDSDSDSESDSDSD